MVSITMDASRNLNELIQPIVSRNEFDNILLVKLRHPFTRDGQLGLDDDEKDGKENKIDAYVEEKNGVVFQRDESELKIIKFDSLVDQKGQSFAFDSIVMSSDVKDIYLVDTKYRLFLQPFLISMETGEIESEQLPEKWALVGLIRTDRFNSESKAISKHLILFFSVLILVGVLSLPIIKMKFMAANDRLKIVDLGLLAYSFLFGVALITLMLLNLYSSLSMGIEMDNQLKKLAAQIDKNFQAEIDSACAQLKNFNELLKQNLPLCSPSASTQDTISKKL